LENFPTFYLSAAFFTFRTVQEIVVAGGQDFRLPQVLGFQVAAFGKVARFGLRDEIGRNTFLVVETLTQTILIAHVGTIFSVTI